MAVNISASVDIMCRAVLMEDNFPNNVEVCRMFLLDRCRGEEEAQLLLGLYIGLFKLHPKYRKAELVAAIERGGLAQYLADLHEGNIQSYYSRWFVSNLARFSQ